MSTSGLDFESLIRACRKAGLKATHQRMEIYRELAQTEDHPDAETIFKRVRKRIPAISFDTVYRTLRAFQENDIISRLGSLSDRSRFDANMRKHHHFVCRKCGLVRDFYSAAFNTLSPPAEAKALGVPQTLQVEIRGLCKTCGRKARAQDAADPAGWG